MFIDASIKPTGNQPMMLHSWICNQGNGPIQKLPKLTTMDLGIISGKNADMVIGDLPMTRDVMLDLCLKQMERKALSSVEAEWVHTYTELPIPTGCLQSSEMSTSYIRSLDNLWREMEV